MYAVTASVGLGMVSPLTPWCWDEGEPRKATLPTFVPQTGGKKKSSYINQPLGRGGLPKEEG